MADVSSLNGYDLKDAQARMDIDTLENDVSEVQSTIGDASSGLVKELTDLEAVVGDSSSGLVKDVADLQSKTLVQIGTTTGTTAISFDATLYDEILIIAFDTTSASGANIHYSINVPTALLSSSNKQFRTGCANIDNYAMVGFTVSSNVVQLAFFQGYANSTGWNHTSTTQTYLFGRKI